jgi:hypothetical protein
MGRPTSDAAATPGALTPVARAGLLLALAVAGAAGPALSQPPRKEAAALALDAATLARITAVDPVHAETMGQQPTTLEVEALPFYKRFRLLTANVALPHRPLRFRYADDGSRAVYLNGSPEAVYQVNAAEALALAADQVAPYLRFFLDVAGGEGRQLVESAEDPAWLPASESDAALKARRAAATGQIRALQVAPDGAGFRVTATVLQGDPHFTRADLVELPLTVGADGRVTLGTARVLQADVPVAAQL